MYPVSTQAYDRAITVFSPDGRLFQVEYAREAVKRGTTALGIVYNDGVLLAIDKKIVAKLKRGESIEKIFKIDQNIGAATSGLVADARYLVDYARTEAQQEKYVYDEAIDVETLTKRICDLKQRYTQLGGVRPFGAALLLIGVDKLGKRLFETDPSGAVDEWYAAAIGGGKNEAEEVLLKDWKKGMSRTDAIKLALKALLQVGDKKISKETIDVAYIEEKKKFTKLPKDKLENYIKDLTEKKKGK